MTRYKLADLLLLLLLDRQ